MIAEARRRLPAWVVLWIAGAALLAGCNYVVLGDSIGRLGSQTYATYYGQTLRVQPDVEAVDGETLGDFEGSLMNDAALRDKIAHADVITISIGSNDLAGDAFAVVAGTCDHTCAESTLTAFEAQYARTLGELRALTKARITVLDIYDPEPQFVGDYVREKLLEINTFIHLTACANGMLPAAVGVAFNGPDGTADPMAEGYLLPDRTHPSDSGAKVIAAAALAAHC